MGNSPAGVTKLELLAYLGKMKTLSFMVPFISTLAAIAQGDAALAASELTVRSTTFGASAPTDCFL
jgi:hypothetical protein